mmetsp:Transcript_95272/g.168719  ORF Transcript_95272/g.168719 Transcript_95272/m.168719 type:complete len:125 (+) Transcript_95272:98-472(+)
MDIKSLKGLNPAMQGKYWNEVIGKEDVKHMHHSLNTHPTQRRDRSVPLGNPQDFYGGAWRTLERRYDQAAGCPSALVQLARRYTNQDQAPSFDSRPVTGASYQPSERSMASSRRPRSLSSSRRY